MTEDQQDMALLQAGQDTALNRIMQRWQTGVFVFVRRYLHSVHDCEDVTQEVFLKVYQRANQYDIEQPFRQWILTIAANEAKNKLRWLKIRSAIPFLETSETAVQIHSVDELEDAINQLVLEERICIGLQLEGHSYKEIAQITGYKERKVETYLERAKASLQDLLKH